MTLHVIAPASVIAIAFDPVRRPFAAFRAAGAAMGTPNPLMACCAFYGQVSSLVRTDVQGLPAMILGTIRVLALIQHSLVRAVPSSAFPLIYNL